MVLGVSLLSLSASACGQKGRFTPYTDGSFLAKGEPEDATLTLSAEPPNGLFHQPRYALSLTFSEASRRHELKLGFIMDGQFEQPSKDQARIRCSCADGMTVKTDDALLQALADHVTISMRKRAEHDYDLELKIFDADNRVVGEFTQRLADEASGASQESPTSPTAVFEWLSRNSGTFQVHQ